jgi:hypothetical protein
MVKCLNEQNSVRDISAILYCEMLSVYNYLCIYHLKKYFVSRRGEVAGKGWRRLNTVEILCTHVWEWEK